MKSTTNFNKAVSVLEGEVVLAHDRRSTNAPRIDYSLSRGRYRSGRAAKVLRPAYGISNTLQAALAHLADKVDYIDGMPNYFFFVKGA